MVRHMSFHDGSTENRVRRSRGGSVCGASALGSRRESISGVSGAGSGAMVCAADVERGGMDGIRAPVVLEDVPRSGEEFMVMQRKMDDMADALNDCKKRLAAKEGEFEEQAVSLRGIRCGFERVEKENERLRSENEALQKMKEDLLVRVMSASTKKGKKSIEAFTSSVPEKFIGVAMKV